MKTDETPDRQTEKPPIDHHFETPVVREARPVRTAHKERDDRSDDPERRPSPEREIAFRDRWEKVQIVFVARGRRRLRPV